MASSVAFGQVQDQYDYDGDGATMGQWCTNQANKLNLALSVLSRAHQCIWFSRYFQKCLDKNVRVPLDGFVFEAGSRYQDLQGYSQKIPRTSSVKVVDDAITRMNLDLKGYRSDLLKRAKSYLIVDKIMNAATRLGFGAKYIAYGLNYSELTQHVTVGVTLPQDCVRFQQDEYLIIPDLPKVFMAGGFSPTEEAQESPDEKKVQSIISNMRSGTATVDDLMSELKHQCRDR